MITIRVYAKYKSKIHTSSLLRGVIEFKVKVRLEGERYPIFRNSFEKYLNSWEMDISEMGDDNMLKLISIWVEDHYSKMQMRNSAKQLITKKWREIEVVIKCD